MKIAIVTDAWRPQTNGVVTGALNVDLRAAALAALEIDPNQCRAYALANTSETATRQFLSHLAPRQAMQSAVESALDLLDAASHRRLLSKSESLARRYIAGRFSCRS